MTTLCGTGHRPNKLGGYDDHVVTKLIFVATQKLAEISPILVIAGGALGWDTALAIAAIRMNIPLTVAVPFLGQETMWPAASQDRYKKVLSKATNVVIVSGGDFSPSKMQTRNKWMVDHSDMVLSLWDGSAGGTANCIEYARHVDKPVVNIWDDWKKLV